MKCPNCGGEPYSCSEHDHPSGDYYQYLCKCGTGWVEAKSKTAAPEPVKDDGADE